MLNNLSGVFQHLGKEQFMRAQMFMPVALAFALLGSAGATADASVLVFGNMGNPSSITNVSATTTDFGPTATNNSRIAAQGFSTGTAELLQVTSVELGLFGTSVGTVNRTVSIYADAGGNPAALPLFTSSTTAIGDVGIYSFSFANAILSAGTNYWVVPQFNENVSWYLAVFPGTLGEYNDSGYAPGGGFRVSNNNISGTWSLGSPTYAMNVNAINPVPEPSSVALAGVGIVVAGLSYRRRLRRAAVTKADDAT
jgi:hypothetical protein